MAFQHIYIDQTKPSGARLKNYLTTLKTLIDQIKDERDTMQTMIDGDGSDASQFGEVGSRYGSVDTTAAFALWNELNSVIFKLTTDATVDHVNAAILQAANKVR